MRIFILTILITFTSQSHGAIHIEPYIGFGKSTVDVNAGSSDSNDDIGHKAVGGKLGWGLLGFDFGVDYEMDTHDDFKRNNISAYAAFDFPVLLRVWAEYVVSSSFEADDIDADLDLKSGTSFGVGFTGVPFFNINVELENTSYSGDFEGTDYDVQWVSYLVSVSMPFDI